MRTEILAAARRSQLSRVWLCQAATTVRALLEDARDATSGWRVWEKPLYASALWLLRRTHEWLCEDVQLPRTGP